MKPVLYSFRRCPYAMRARLAIAASGVQVELREILLRDKAPEFLEASSKATVPVLIDDRNIIDESLDIMHWALNRRDPEQWLERHNSALILECDGAFKSALDRYKYGNRFEDDTALQHRKIASEFIEKIDSILASTPYLSGSEIGLTDMAIVTFIRQFANVDRVWFDNQPWPNTLTWLEGFLASDAFNNMMKKYPKWQSGDTPIYFPEAT